MTPPNTLADVVRFGLCTGCGLCESMGGESLPMQLNAQGNLRPRVPDDLDSSLETEILECCPGIHQNGMHKDSARAFGDDALWGPSTGLFLAHATDADLRHKASSAGVVSAAAAWLLQSGRADAVLHVGADPERPVRSTARISTTAQHVVDGSGARYGPVGPLTLLHGLLAQGRRIVVIGKPCDIAAVRNLACRDARAKSQIVATVSFLCAGLPNHRVSRNIIEKYGLAEDEISLLRYRGYGCPGTTRIETRDGRVFEQSYQETWGSDLNSAIQFRCKICPDSTGEQADLVCSDAWEGGEGYPFGEGKGENVIIVRTQVGQKLFDELVASGRVVAEPLEKDRLGDMQPHHARRKTQVLARLAGLALMRQPLPVYRDLRLWRAAVWGVGGALSNMSGMMRRVRRGNNREALPTGTDFALATGCAKTSSDNIKA